MTIMQTLADGLDTALDLTVVPGYSRIGLAVRRHLPTWPPDPQRMDGTQVLVTGASSGLGAATAQGLARLGAHVHVVVRDVDVARRALSGLDGAATFWRCDLADLDDVERLADGIRTSLTASGGRLSALVHNAGAMPARRTESAQGHELTMALHVLGPVLLTERLLPVLDAARIVLVTSGGMYAERLHADDPDFRQGSYAPAAAYARSKRAQVELLGPLQRRWGSAGHTVGATHPGWADTPGVAESLPRFRRLMGPVLRDADGGADTTVWFVGTRPAPPGGRLWQDRRARPTTWLGLHTPTEADRARLWRWTRDAARLADAPRPTDTARPTDATRPTDTARLTDENGQGAPS